MRSCLSVELTKRLTQEDLGDTTSSSRNKVFRCFSHRAELFFGCTFAPRATPRKTRSRRDWNSSSHVRRWPWKCVPRLVSYKIKQTSANKIRPESCFSDPALDAFSTWKARQDLFVNNIGSTFCAILVNGKQGNYTRDLQHLNLQITSHCA
jgi:hypothetical protein